MPLLSPKVSGADASPASRSKWRRFLSYLTQPRAFNVVITDRMELESTAFVFLRWHYVQSVSCNYSSVSEVEMGDPHKACWSFRNDSGLGNGP